MARIVRIYEYGDPSVLKIEDIEVPPPSSGEAQIEVKSIGLNRAEVCGLKPGSTVRSEIKVRMSSAAAIRRTIDSAISLITSTDRVMLRRTPLPDRQPDSFKSELRSARDTPRAGINPKTIPVTSETQIVNTKTRQSSDTADPFSPIRGIGGRLRILSPATAGSEIQLSIPLERSFSHHSSE